MTARDLRVQPPRRWSDAIDGIQWLPRLIDKTRAAQTGKLGSYFFGQSPFDRALLHAFGVGYRSFSKIVADAPDDATILSALCDQDPASLDRARAWSQTLATRHRLMMMILDADDGYAKGAWQPLKPLVNACANAFSWIVKRIWPSRVNSKATRG